MWYDVLLVLGGLVLGAGGFLAYFMRRFQRGIGTIVARRPMGDLYYRNWSYGQIWKWGLTAMYLAYLVYLIYFY